MNHIIINWKRLFPVFSILWILSGSLTGCDATVSPLSNEISPTASNSYTATSTFTPSTATPSPLPPTPTTTPPPIDVDVDEQAGLIILAMQNGPYQQLFAYHPVYFPLTRFTSGEWDTNDPAVSPDGTRLAYCDNRSGFWNIVILDLINGVETPFTPVSSYACSPNWSPDGQWIAYEALYNGKLGIFLQSITDLNSLPVQLTDGVGNNSDPDWAPGGRQIAFVSDRNQRSEIWLANLDAPVDRLSLLASSEIAEYFAPNWSPDGTALAWQTTSDFATIEVLHLAESQSEPVNLGTGVKPFWISEQGDVGAILQSANAYDLVSYRGDPTLILYPAIRLPGQVSAATWHSGNFVKNLIGYLEKTSPVSNEETENEEPDTSDLQAGKYEQVMVQDIDAPQPYLSNAVVEDFNTLRNILTAKLGWDFLGTLENASISLPTEPQTADAQDWLYSGRAIAVNFEPYEAGWMSISREDYNGRTYWRIWLKCLAQDGSCGVPLKDTIWDFDARYNGETDPYEEGGKPSSPPEGFWVDFTALALQYGWERLPAETNWRGYFPATRINLYVHADGLTWRQAMEEIFSSEEVRALWP